MELVILLVKWSGTIFFGLLGVLLLALIIQALYLPFTKQRIEQRELEREFQKKLV